MRRLAFALLLLSLLIVSKSASAAPITFAFVAQVTQANDVGLSITAGQTLTGTYTFESTATDLDPATDAGKYQGGSTVPIDLTVAFQTPTFSTTLTSPNTTESIFVGDQFFGDRDQYSVSVTRTSGISFLIALVSLNDLTIFSSDGLPLTPPTVSRFEASNSVQISSGTGGVVNATLTSLTLVPEPTTALLMLAGVLALTGWRRRLH